MVAVTQTCGYLLHGCSQWPWRGVVLHIPFYRSTQQGTQVRYNLLQITQFLSG